jgi:coatomer subunit beta'
MPLRLDIEKKLHQRSERVKCVDIHPTETWVLATLYDGRVFIYDYETGGVVKTFEVTDQPVRCGVFVPRKQWIVVGADDMYIRCYNYNTMEKVKIFEAHIDYIRSISVHPTLPMMVSCSDDMLIKAWDWEKNWDCTMMFEGHSHYVMQVKFNPKDPNTFASASLDHTVKVWNLSSPVPNFTLEGHEKGVNCVDYYNGGDKPYLVTGGDDRAIRVWDYQTKACVQKLDGHSHNVSCVAFLPDRPLIVSGSEDGSVLLWHSNTYRLEQTLNYGMDRCWSVAYLKGANKVALGFDEGTVLVQMGKDTPVASMDSGGKVILAKHNEVSAVNVKTVQGELSDGERLVLPSKELGSCEIYPQTLAHSPNGRFVAVCGDGEYIIYTALNLRNKSFGPGDQVVWDISNGEYATRLGPSDIRVHDKSFKERKSIRPPFSAESIFGGNLLAVSGQDFICFYDWDDLQLVRRIDVEAKAVYWSDQGHLLAVVGESEFFVLQYSQAAVDAALDAGGNVLPEDGVDAAFELVHQVSDSVQTGRWVGDCFVYTNSNARLNYAVGAEVTTLVHLERPMYLLGYLPKENRLYCIDKEHNIASFTLLLAVLEFKTAVVRGALEIAKAKVLPRIPVAEHNKLARFLESQGLRDDALNLATDPDYRCDLAIGLSRLDLATEIAREHPSELKWRQLADLATMKGDFVLAKECMDACDDFSGLLTLHAARSDREALKTLADLSSKAHKMNTAFLASFMAGDLEKCLTLLVNSGRIPEAAVFARTYLPSKISPIVELWRASLRKAGNVRIADALADPTSHPHLFPEYDESLEGEKAATALFEKRKNLPSTAFASYMGEIGMDLADIIGAIDLNGNAETDTLTNGHGKLNGVSADPTDDDTTEPSGDALLPYADTSGTAPVNETVSPDDLAASMEPFGEVRADTIDESAALNGHSDLPEETWGAQDDPELFSADAEAQASGEHECTTSTERAGVSDFDGPDNPAAFGAEVPDENVELEGDGWGGDIDAEKLAKD